MKKIANNIINTINLKRNNENYEWSDILLRSAVLGFAIYVFAVIDMIIYGFLTR
ncbi:MAG TPA: hypothetical protein VN026_09770 [Bacteroidia bacterium]|jgi:hypothetical protein|nr:hypothetical protein [Bacteroidia bacterium]